MSAYKTHIILFSLLLTFIGCKKVDEASSEPRLDSPYCNQPEAINYNIGFPGKPDNTKCIFPTEVFRGTYTFTDSILDADYKLKKTNTIEISLTAVSNTKMYLKGLCGATGDSITLTADRYYKCYIDSLTITYNAVDYKISGQFLCSKADTINGYMSKYPADSTKMVVFLTQLTDAGIIYHKGTAIKK